MEDFRFMAATGREKGSGGTQEMETRRDGNWRNQFASTIKERNSRDYVDFASPRPRPRPSPRPGPAQPAARARVALLCPFLSFSIMMDNFQPNKLSQRSVKILYGIKPYNA